MATDDRAARRRAATRGRRRRLLATIAAVAASASAAASLPSAQAVGCPTPNGDAYSTAVFADSPVAYYRLDEASGAVLCDSSSSANNGTYNASGITYGVAGALSSSSDTAVAADGTSGVIATSGANTPISGNESFTLEGWYRDTGTTQNQVLVDIGFAPLAQIAGLTLWPTGGGCAANGSSIGLDIYTASNCWDTTAVGVHLFDGQWHYVAITYDATSDQLTGYADGQSLGAQTPTDPLNLTASPVRIGWWQPDTTLNKPFVGDADEIAVYSSALSAARIAAHWSAATTNPAKTLTVAVAGSGSGTVTSNPAGISCPGTCSHNYATGTPVSLTAAASRGSRFTGWSGACSGTGACSLTMSADRAVTATFTRTTPAPSPALDGTYSGSNTGPVSGSVTFTVSQGKIVSFNASISGGFCTTISSTGLSRAPFDPSGSISQPVLVGPNGSFNFSVPGPPTFSAHGRLTTTGTSYVSVGFGSLGPGPVPGSFTVCSASDQIGPLKHT